MQQMIRIQQCPGGLVHLSIGAMTVRLDQTSFLAVATVIHAAATRLQQQSVTAEAPKLRVINGEQQ
ncbi:MAG: hypothetical protein FJ146_05150 [Deltaproteobacteria bacterium]|nr:hypothetical protein [Deltaproteobacteria bacterium]